MNIILIQLGFFVKFIVLVIERLVLKQDLVFILYILLFENIGLCFMIEFIIKLMNVY